MKVTRIIGMSIFFCLAGSAGAQERTRDWTAADRAREAEVAARDAAVYRARARDRIGPAIGPGVIGPLEPIEPWEPEIDWGVQKALDFNIGSYGTTRVNLRWWNVAARQTRVLRSVNGGPWSEIQVFGPLPDKAYIDHVDLQATANTENCYRIATSTGTGVGPSFNTPARCVITREVRPGINLRVYRLQLRLRVANVADAGTDDALEVRLQSPSWLVPTVTNWKPAGNSTWVDSTANDFERGSDKVYDLMLDNVATLPDITQVTLAKPGSDSLCVAGLDLYSNGLLAYSRTYGDTAATCAPVGGDAVLSVDYNALRSSAPWQQVGTVIPTGYDGASLRAIIEAYFGHGLHGFGELRNGGTISNTRASEDRLNVSVPIRVHDVPILGDVDSDVRFDLVLTPNGRMSIENVDADSSDVLGYFLPVVGWGLLYGISSGIEATLEDMKPVGSSAPLPPGTHPCFTQDGGVSVCFDP
jgi:hypothetical protein